MDFSGPKDLSALLDKIDNSKIYYFGYGNASIMVFKQIG